MDYTYAFTCTGLGLLAITAIATVGAIASQKLNFKYGYLSGLSLIIYISVSYAVSKQYSLSTALLANAILGLYDGTIGLKLCLLLNANIEQQIKDHLREKTITALPMIFIALLFALLGYGLSVF